MDNMAWYNFKTGEFDYTDPVDFHDYIPQNFAAQALYDVLLKAGKDPLHAVTYVLEAVTGTPHLYK